MRPRILLFEDDAELGAQIVTQLEAAGLVVEWHRSADLAVDPDYTKYQLIVLDLMLPGAYGLDVLRTIRETSDVPILIVSARDDSVDVVRGLKAGADDYLRKPYWPNELLARVQARLRRSADSKVVRIDGLQIDLNARTVHLNDVPVSLSRTEFELLAALARRVGVAVSRDWLNEHVLGDDDFERRTLDVHLSRLRKKVGSHRIITIHGVGYRLSTESGK